MGAKRLLNLVSDRLHALPLVVLYLTDGCNSRCVTCDIWRNPRRNMKMEMVEEIVFYSAPAKCLGKQTELYLDSMSHVLAFKDHCRFQDGYLVMGATSP